MITSHALSIMNSHNFLQDVASWCKYFGVYYEKVNDIKKILINCFTCTDPDLVPHIKLTLVEAGPGILGSFDKALSEYYLRELEKKNIDVR